MILVALKNMANKNITNLPSLASGCHLSSVAAHFHIINSQLKVMQCVCKVSGNHKTVHNRHLINYSPLGYISLENQKKCQIVTLVCLINHFQNVVTNSSSFDNTCNLAFYSNPIYFQESIIELMGFKLCETLLQLASIQQQYVTVALEE